MMFVLDARSQAGNMLSFQKNHEIHTGRLEEKNLSLDLVAQRKRLGAVCSQPLAVESVDEPIAQLCSRKVSIQISTSAK